MEWSSVIAGLVVGIGVGFLVSYPVGFLREVGREHASRRLRSREEARERRRAEEAAAALRDERDAEARRQQEHLQQLQQQRVGVQFLHKVERDDMGLRATVLELDPRQPKQRVIVQYEPMANRPSTPHDPPLGQRVSIEWRALTAPHSEQRHRTARLIENSYDDSDGWVEYERIDA